MHAPSAVTNNGAGHGAAERPRLGAHVSVVPDLGLQPASTPAMCAGYDLHDPTTATATASELDKLLHGRLALMHTTSGQVVAEWGDDR